MSKSNSKGIMF